MISRALRIEWLKAKSSKTFRIFSVIYIFSLIGAIFFINEIEFPKALDSGAPLSGENVYLFVGYAYNWIIFLLGGILAIRLVTLEFVQNTWRQAVMSGARRWELWIHKLVFMVFISLLASAIFLIACIVSGSIYSGFSAALPSAMEVLRSFLITFGYLMFGALLGWLVKRNTASILLYIGYALFIEPFLRWTVHGSVVSQQHVSMNYYPLNALEDLFPNPLIKLKELAGAMSEEDASASELANLVLSQGEAVTVSSIYIGLFILASWLLIRKINL